MTKRALLIGSAYNTPPGVVNDIAAMTKLLAPRDFVVRTLVGAAATRAAILDQLAALQAEVNSDDVVVIYYAGHGGHGVDTGVPTDGGAPRRIQCICPSDYDQSTDDDLRAVTAWDLSLASAAITKTTPNLTWIFDCCYAGGMSRGTDEPPRGRATPTRVSFARYFERLRATHPDLTDFPPLGNPNAVRVVACGEDDSAYPTPAPPKFQCAGGDDHIGALTLALAEVFATLGDNRWSWRAIVAALRERVGAHANAQRPDVEGPGDRLPFSTELGAGSVAGIVSTGDHFELATGSLLGVSVGDRWAVMAGREPTVVVQVYEVTPVRALARLVEQTAPLPESSVAVLRRRAFRRVAITVPTSSAQRDQIATELAATDQLRLAADGDTALAEVSLDMAGVATIRDPRGVLFSDLSLDVAINRLIDLAAVRRLHEEPDSQGIAPSEVDVTFGTAEGGKFRERPPTGDVLGLGDRVAIRVKNLLPGPVFAHLFSVGSRGRITSLEDPRGRRVAAGAEAILGTNVTSDLVGYRLSWPPGLPESPPRVDSLLTIVTRAPVDLSELGSSTHERDDASDGTLLQWRDHWLFPIQAALGLPRFERDDHPTMCDGPPDERQVSARVTLRSATPCRVDVLVVTAGSWVARTVKISDKLETLELPLTASRFLEICVWQSPETAAPDLATALADRALPLVNSPGAARRVIAEAADIVRGTGVYHTAATSTDSYGGNAAPIAVTCEQLTLEFATAT